MCGVAKKKKTPNERPQSRLVLLCEEGTTRLLQRELWVSDPLEVLPWEGVTHHVADPELEGHGVAELQGHGAHLSLDPEQVQLGRAPRAPMGLQGREDEGRGGAFRGQAQTQGAQVGRRTLGHQRPAFSPDGPSRRGAGRETWTTLHLPNCALDLGAGTVEEILEMGGTLGNPHVSTNPL